ncbi:YdcH family protein [Novosphingobium sp. JCM 18896]|nr:YdcH family protein [Novosphingobium sp. JCM 18896]
MPNWLFRLTLIHKRIDAEIEREKRRRVPNNFRLIRLKKLRLAVKDRLAAGMRRMRPA